MQTDPREIVNEIIQKRIAVLTGIIANKDDMESATLAVMQLGLIGTKESADALMSVAEQTSDTEMKDTIIQSLIIFSPFRNDYRERIERMCSDASDVEEAYAATTACNQRLLDPPLWQEIAEACASEFTRKLGAINDRGPSD
ncbi:hypothetical protein A2524_00995 [Candidatus Wolfebacteria bacterium RIFOXYD12_FULL_48_21]|uniref:Uncharacterized protein n=1 Tax=Candidatus Wolfebacteria bacterium RIFOXYD1_FULL_48_65 TaxID=1802561 RepID=A0A1F8E0D1_9BACT|nr:MAG: hypothetical protein A2610_02940 [Candidatus Wolfebacteria bacterium RIFOXYD1_FULL_48_65]OGM94385.1 MAG: hypothetical protein A2524_00995 [Candidatus Wolfebacteria bacterium RIFOXYD12_FULL_48_21]OGM96928.1 MAG: hypothetical protein A2532_01205 [Candidatus Wolfebacteria bacterium RIFOXYD2_FULL_48_11]